MELLATSMIRWTGGFLEITLHLQATFINRQLREPGRSDFYCESYENHVPYLMHFDHKFGGASPVVVVTEMGRAGAVGTGAT